MKQSILQSSGQHPASAALAHSRTTLSMLIVVIVLIATAVTACGERKVSHYPDLAEAERQGAIARGWVPGRVPRSATRIHEVHYVDKSESWGAFELSPADAEVFGIDLEPVSHQAISELHVRSPGEEWWPSELVGDLSATQIEAKGIELFSLREAEATVYFAAKKQERRVFFGRP